MAKNPGGRRPGDSGTKDAILDAARDQFGAKGYQAATIRGIAAQAGVDPALIRHFYGNKEQLFAATLDLPTWFGDHVEGVFDGDTDGLGERCVRSFLNLWENPESSAPVQAMLRSAFASTDAAKLLRDFLTARVTRKLENGLATERSDLRIALASSTLLGVAIARYVTEVEPIANLDRDELVAILAPTTQQILTGDLPKS
ncbi:hypothetical protein A5621_13535 [Mycobacterium colombiense]|nr:hypothetical protein A5621_13535 [Mycobacterium colombiense]